MGHDLGDKLTDYWTTSDELYTPFYSNAAKRDTYRHILRFPHFTDKNEPDRKDKIFTDWKIRKLFEILNRTLLKCCNHSQHVAVYELIGLYKGRVVFRQYGPTKHKRFGIKIYKLREETGYTYDMKVQMGKKTQRRVQNLTVAHVTVTEKLQGRGHKLHMDNFLSSRQLFQDFPMKIFTVVALSDRTRQACHKT
jgi:hypothetical protein